MNYEQELKSVVYIDEVFFPCNTKDNCPIKERSISYAVGVDLPTDDFEDKDKIFKECCYEHFVFADLNSNKDFKNDYVSFYYQRELMSEKVDFVLLDLKKGDEIELKNDDFGTFFGFGYFEQNRNFKGFKLEWKKVLEQLGEGAYKVITKINKLGVSIERQSITYNLKQYSTDLVDKTFRIDVVLNGLMIKQKVDFSGLMWQNSMRLPGFFGRREFEFNEDILISRKFERRQISMHQTNEYKMQTNMLPNCVIRPIIDLFLYADYIYMNDYNLNNHSYDYRKFLVSFKSNENTNYYVTSRKARLNLLFSDKIENNWKRNFK